MRDVDEGYKNWDNNLSIRYLASPLPNTHLDIVEDDKFTFSIDSDFILVFNYSSRVLFFPVLGTSDITEAYEVGDRRHAYMFFTVVAL
jgi:hypothetical protein